MKIAYGVDGRTGTVDVAMGLTAAQRQSRIADLDHKYPPGDARWATLPLRMRHERGLLVPEDQYWQAKQDEKNKRDKQEELAPGHYVDPWDGNRGWILCACPEIPGAACVCCCEATAVDEAARTVACISSPAHGASSGDDRPWSGRSYAVAKHRPLMKHASWFERPTPGRYKKARNHPRNQRAPFVGGSEQKPRKRDLRRVVEWMQAQEWIPLSEYLQRVWRPAVEARRGPTPEMTNNRVDFAAWRQSYEDVLSTDVPEARRAYPVTELPFLQWWHDPRDALGLAIEARNGTLEWISPDRRNVRRVRSVDLDEQARMQDPPLGLWERLMYHRPRKPWDRSIRIEAEVEVNDRHGIKHVWRRTRPLPPENDSRYSRRDDGESIDDRYSPDGSSARSRLVARAPHHPKNEGYAFKRVTDWRFTQPRQVWWWQKASRWMAKRVRVETVALVQSEPAFFGEYDVPAPCVCACGSWQQIYQQGLEKSGAIPCQSAGKFQVLWPIERQLSLPESVQWFNQAEFFSLRAANTVKTVQGFDPSDVKYLIHPRRYSLCATPSLRGDIDSDMHCSHDKRRELDHLWQREGQKNSHRVWWLNRDNLYLGKGVAPEVYDGEVYTNFVKDEPYIDSQGQAHYSRRQQERLRFYCRVQDASGRVRLFVNDRDETGNVLNPDSWDPPVTVLGLGRRAEIIRRDYDCALLESSLRTYFKLGPAMLDAGVPLRGKTNGVAETWWRWLLLPNQEELKALARRARRLVENRGGTDTSAATAGKKAAARVRHMAVLERAGAVYTVTRSYRATAKVLTLEGWGKELKLKGGVVNEAYVRRLFNSHGRNQA